MSEDWRECAALLPTEKTDEDKEKRKDLFMQWDPNGNGYLSLAEIDKGLSETEGMELLYGCKPAMMRAYQGAKAVKNAKSESDDDFVTKEEFRVLLVYLKLYLALYQIFDAIDTGDDRRVDLEEFKEAAPSLREMGCPVAEEEEEDTFKEIDKDGFGQILFNEFSEWAIQNNVIAHEAIDFPDKEEEDNEEEEEGGEEEEEEAGGPTIKPLSENEDFQTVAAALPVTKSEEDVKARKKLFRQWDPNGNGYLSLAEIDKGISEGGAELAALYGCKPAMMRAYMAAKDVKSAKTKHDDDYVTHAEFRLLLVFLKLYFGFYSVFDAVDTGDDRRIDLDEFTAAADSLRELGVPVGDDPAKAFAKADKDGHGQVLFDEFAAWCLQHNALVKEASAPAKKKAPKEKAPKEKDDGGSSAPRKKGLKPVKDGAVVVRQPSMNWGKAPPTFEEMPPPRRAGKMVALRASQRALEIEKEEKQRRMTANQIAILKAGA